MLSLEEENQIKAVLYGQCIGDAIGLLTEFLPKEDAKKVRIRRIHVDQSSKVHGKCVCVCVWGGYPSFAECKIK